MEKPQQQDQTQRTSARPQQDVERDLKERAENIQPGVGQTTRRAADDEDDQDQDLDEEVDPSTSRTSRGDEEIRPGGPSTEPKKWAERKDHSQDDAISQ